MRTLHLLACASLTWALVAGTARAETADEIVAKTIEALGGADAIRAVTTLRRVGKFVGSGGYEAVVVQENKREGRVRNEWTEQGMTGVTAFDGQSGWRIAPWDGKKDAEPLGEEEAKETLDRSDFDGPLVDAARKGNVIEMKGEDSFEGSAVWRIDVTRKNGDVLRCFIEKARFIPIKIETKRTIRGGERVTETVLGDYKSVAGWWLPHSIATRPKGTQEYSKTVYDFIEANVAVDDARFAQPPVGKGAEQTKPRTYRRENPTSAEAPPRRETPAAPPAFDGDTISGLGARNIGSAQMSGRIAAIDAVHEGRRLTVWIGSASGGVWKSDNGGTTYKPVFDDQPVQSIGAVAADRRDHKTAWVGTGEAWTRNSVSIGDGVYKTTDGGETWSNMGLAASEHIAKIAIDPTDSNTVYVCATGPLWSDGGDRGVFKTTDGGQSWKQILKGPNASTGASMMSIDPKNPKTVFAALWDFRRKGWTFRSGGEGKDAPSGSGLFKSDDGGATWSDLDEKSAKGLPAKPWGRVAVTIAPSKPSTVYAFIEAPAPRNGMYRSDDGGATWTALDRGAGVVWRPFYFANVIVDPTDEKKVYKPDGSFWASDDGAATFSDISGGAHGDFHDVWIDPEDPDHLITGDDGGVWTSYDAGGKWWKSQNLPVSQFYHVSVDMDRPYHVYGGLQDNSSWMGDSQYPGGITNSRWENLYGGDGFCAFVDPADPDYAYVESQGGEIGRVNKKTHESRNIKPLPRHGEGKLRFNWNTPIHMSRTKAGVLYIGAQFLFRSADRGQTWDRISPDLTTNDPEKQKQEQSGGVTIDNSVAEMHTTITAICESQKNADVVWAGADDGNLQVTKDAGKTWTNVVGAVPGLPKNAWVTSIDTGYFDAATAYVTFDAHTFGDMRPYVFVTTDLGATFRRVVAADSPVRGYAHVIKQDLVAPDLLYLGTEFGLWISIDGGARWAQYRGGDLPCVAVRDLAIHPRDDALVVATHGRGIWIVDDITPLRALTSTMLAADLAIVHPKPAVQSISGGGGWVNGDAEFVGANPSDDAAFVYYQRERQVFGTLDIEVLDASGKSLEKIPSGARRGLNRVEWSMRLPPPRVPAAAGGAGGASIGPRLPPGTYTVKIAKGGSTCSTQLEVAADPRSTHTAAERAEQFALSMKLYDLLTEMTYQVDRIDGVRVALEARVSAASADAALAESLRGAVAKIDAFRGKIVATKEGGEITGEERLRENLADLYGAVVGYEGRPSATQTERAAAISTELADVVKEFDAFVAASLPGLNSVLSGAHLEPVEVLTLEQWRKRTAPRRVLRTRDDR